MPQVRRHLTAQPSHTGCGLQSDPFRKLAVRLEPIDGRHGERHHGQQLGPQHKRGVDVRDPWQALWHCPTKTHSAPRQKWLKVADSGCAQPPTHWLRLSALTTRPCVLARVERGHNVSTNVFWNGNTTPRCEPSLDHLLDGPVNRWQRLLHVPPMLRPIPLFLRAERKRVCPRSIPVIAVPACLLLPGLFGRSQFDGRPPLAVVHLVKIAIAYIQD